MKRLLLRAGILAALWIEPGVAEACGMHPVPEAAIHNALPTPLPAGTVVADVELDPGLPGGSVPDGDRVRVRRMIQGEPASTLILLTDLINSCQSAWSNGSSGLIVAIPEGHRKGVPVVRPIFVHRSDGYRLPDGFRLPVRTPARQFPQ